MQPRPGKRRGEPGFLVSWAGSAPLQTFRSGTWFRPVSTSSLTTSATSPPATGTRISLIRQLRCTERQTGKLQYREQGVGSRCSKEFFEPSKKPWHHYVHELTVLASADGRRLVRWPASASPGSPAPRPWSSRHRQAGVQTLVAAAEQLPAEPAVSHPAGGSAVVPQVTREEVPAPQVAPAPTTAAAPAQTYAPAPAAAPKYTQTHEPAPALRAGPTHRRLPRRRPGIRAQRRRQSGPRRHQSGDVDGRLLEFVLRRRRLPTRRPRPPSAVRSAVLRAIPDRTSPSRTPPPKVHDLTMSSEALWALGRGNGIVALAFMTLSVALGVANRSGRPLFFSPTVRHRRHPPLRRPCRDVAGGAAHGTAVPGPLRQAAADRLRGSLPRLLPPGVAGPGHGGLRPACRRGHHQST